LILGLFDDVVLNCLGYVAWNGKNDELEGLWGVDGLRKTTTSLTIGYPWVGFRNPHFRIRTSATHTWPRSPLPFKFCDQNFFLNLSLLPCVLHATPI